MLRPTLIACPDCACHVRADEGTCPHCGANLAGLAASPGGNRTLKRAAVAVSLGLAVSVAQLTACDDVSGSGGAGGASTTKSSSSASSTQKSSGSLMGSDSSAIATYGVASASSSTGGN